MIHNDSDTIGVLNYPLQESNRLVDSPLSLEVLRREGVDPVELLYKPLGQFKDTNSDIANMRYNYHEQRRRGLLVTQI